MTAGWRSLAGRLGVDHPLLLAPMAGGPSTPALAAAVSNAGGLGSLGAAYLTPDQLRAEILETRRLTDRPFAVNLFAGGATEGAEDAGPMLDLVARWHARLGIDPPTPPAPPADAFDAQLAVVLEMEVPAFSFTFGIPGAEARAELRRRGVFTIGTATTVREAVALEEAGIAAVAAQGSEAGGHRGTFLAAFDAAMIGTLALVPQMVDAVRIPVIASGGIMDGRGIAAARALGASGVSLGTAYLATDEAGTSPPYRERLLASAEDATGITRAFSGRPARGIRNAFMAAVEAERVPVPPFPLQNAVTRPLRTAAARAGDAEALSLWAGQGLRLLRTGGAEALTRHLIADADRIARSLADGLS